MAGETLGGRTVLVVDDERLLCDMLARALRGAGATVQTATSGSAAVAAAAGGRFDLALVDKRLGSEDGVALIGQLRQLQPGLVVVIMTGFASVEDSLAALDAGAAGYLLKPFDALDDVLRELDDILGRDERRRRATVPPANAPSGRPSAPPGGRALERPPAEVVLALPRADERQVVRRGLEQGGFAVEEVGSATELLETLMRHAFDAVVVDAELPDAEGVQTLERVRALSKRVVMLLVGAPPPLAQATRLLRMGQTSFVRRPIDVRADLVHKLELALARRREAEARR